MPAAFSLQLIELYIHGRMLHGRRENNESDVASSNQRGEKKKERRRNETKGWRLRRVHLVIGKTTKVFSEGYRYKQVVPLYQIRFLIIQLNSRIMRDTTTEAMLEGKLPPYSSNFNSYSGG